MTRNVKKMRHSAISHPFVHGPLGQRSALRFGKMGGADELITDRSQLSVSASRGPAFRRYLLNGRIDHDETCGTRGFSMRPNFYVIHSYNKNIKISWCYHWLVIVYLAPAQFDHRPCRGGDQCDPMSFSGMASEPLNGSR